MTATTVGVVGLGKLGLPLALVLAEAGHTVHVWDSNPDVREGLKAGRADHVDEPDVEALLAAHRLEISPPALLGNLAEVIYVVVPTPSLPDGNFNATHVVDAVASLQPSNRIPRRPVVSLVSTVSPGTGEKIAAFADHLGMEYVYTPVMIALGSVVHDLRHPEFQLIGWNGRGRSSRTSAAYRSAEVLRSICHGTYAPRFMSYGSAEIAKLASNTFATMKISFANLLAQLCEQYGGDVSDVSEVLGMRSFIGPRLLTAGAGYGGPCYPRDTLAFDAAGGSPLGQTIHRLNRDHARWVVSRAIEVAVTANGPPRTFCVLGRGYKDGSNYRIESFGDDLVRRLTDDYCLTAVPAPEADIVVIALPLRGFTLGGRFKPGAVVLDLWRSHPHLAGDNVTYLPLGVAQ